MPWRFGLESPLVPTYAYACTECDHNFEQVQSFSDDSLTVCPECSGRLRKLFNAVGVVFKGSGFYKTDSRAAEKSDSSSGSSGGADSGSKEAPRKPAGGAQAAAEGGSAAKSDSKPASSKPASSAPAASAS